MDHLQAYKRNLIITGPCGVGKTWLGCALAHAASRDGVTIVYTRLFEELELSYGDGRFPPLIKRKRAEALFQKSEVGH
jgi:DNA replication protein DnaC